MDTLGVLGLFEVMCVGKQAIKRVRFVDYKATAHAKPLILIAEDGTIYNWSTIISMKPIEE